VWDPQLFIVSLGISGVDTSLHALVSNLLALVYEPPIYLEFMHRMSIFCGQLIDFLKLVYFSIYGMLVELKSYPGFSFG
jgi:hypothetical protein